MSFLLLLSVSQTAKAQYNTRNEWYIGPSGGVTISTVTLVPKMVDKLFTIRNDGGLMLRYISEDHFGLQTEINYFQTGWKEDLEGFGKYSYSRKLDFIEVPFLLHAFTQAGNHVRLFLNAGPKIGLLYSESEELINTSEANNFVQHGKKVEMPFQYGLLGGGGLEVHVGHSVLGLEGRYGYNLSDLFDNAVGDDFNTSSLQTISVNLYYLFQIK
ncbi:MAG: porin family protein [Bacteroidota bacterium]|nr:porin family protein [Bacteroidota bacterium]